MASHQDQDARTKGSLRHLRVALLAASLALGQAHAMTVVESGPNLVQSILNQINTYIQRGQDRIAHGLESTHRVEELAHMSQQLAGLQSYMDRVMPMGLTQVSLQERALSYGVETKCPGEGGVSDFSLGTLWQKFKPKLEEEISKQQRQVCQLIQMAQNAKYNEIVRVMKNLEARSAEAQGLSIGRQGVGTSEGQLATNSNDVSRFLANTTVDIQYSETAIRAYDNLISSLNADQELLARQGLNGKRPSVIGTVSQGVMLKSALETLKARDR